MANLKSLAKDTAIYGLSSIIGRFLNYLLVPLYTARIASAGGGYGIITNLYAYTALILVILTFGMETTFFRFVNKAEHDPHRVYSTTLISVGGVSLVFALGVLAFLAPLCRVMGYADHPSYVAVMALTVAFDAFQCIPFAYLRYKKRPIKFAMLKLLFIMLNILLNLVYFLFLPMLYTDYPQIICHIYDPTIGVGYAFYLNLACTALVTVFFYKELTGFSYVFDRKLFDRMLRYALPILVLGIAGILNQTADKILFPYLYASDEAHAQLGIYGACVKVAMIMAMLTQAFRYAYEPFVFGHASDKDNKSTYAQAMKYFIIVSMTAYLAVMGYMDILRHVIGADYREGLKVVPVVMAAEILMGIYFNLSFWYKLIDQTKWGGYFSTIGCVVLITANIVFVPRYGYMACAWAGVAGYGTAMLLSYIVGQKKYPIPYDLRGITIYVILTAGCYLLISISNDQLPSLVAMACNTVIICGFIAFAVKRDFTAIGQKIKQRISHKNA